MQGRTKNPLKEFHDILLSIVKEEYTTGKTKDQICDYILMNNGCAVSDNVTYTTIPVKSLTEYNVRLAFGITGNGVNKCFDYVNFYGVRYLIIFMDNILNVLGKAPDEIFGRSELIEILTKLADVFINTAYADSNIKGIESTSAANMYRFSADLIAFSIIDKVFSLTDLDTSNTSYDDVRNMLDNIGIDLILTGVRLLE